MNPDAIAKVLTGDEVSGDLAICLGNSRTKGKNNLTETAHSAVVSSNDPLAPFSHLHRKR
jgi:hypothetical protein